ncbi:hypothetical protein H101_07792, partial [Trichophyton interdigitale H6]
MSEVIHLDSAVVASVLRNGLFICTPYAGYIDFPPPSAVSPFSASASANIYGVHKWSTSTIPSIQDNDTHFSLVDLDVGRHRILPIPEIVEKSPIPNCLARLGVALFPSIRPAFASSHPPFFEALVAGVIGSILMYSYSTGSPNIFSAQSTMKSGLYVAFRSGLLWRARCLMKSPDRCYQ